MLAKAQAVGWGDLMCTHQQQGPVWGKDFGSGISWSPSVGLPEVKWGLMASLSSSSKS